MTNYFILLSINKSVSIFFKTLNISERVERMKRKAAIRIKYLLSRNYNFIDIVNSGVNITMLYMSDNNWDQFIKHLTNTEVIVPNIKQIYIQNMESLNLNRINLNSSK